MKTTDLLMLDQLLSSGSYPTITEISESIGQATTHCYAAIRKLRSELGYDILLNKEQGGWGYGSEPATPPHVDLGAGGRYETVLWLWHAMTTSRRPQSLMICRKFGHQILEVLPISLLVAQGRPSLRAVTMPDRALVDFPLQSFTILGPGPRLED